MTETVENLNRLLKAARRRIAKLKREVRRAEERAEGLERQLDTNTLGWSRHREWTEEDLPVPRLEMHWERTSEDGYERVALYVLVYRHFLDGCGDKPKIEAVPMGLTRVSGGHNRTPWFWNGAIETPFRDGAHFKHDAKHLGLPAFVTTEDGDVTQVNPDTGEQTWVHRSEFAPRSP